MSIISGSAAISTAAGSSDFYEFPIGQSLMFSNSDNTYLSRTLAGSTSDYTISFWFKRSRIDTGPQYLISNVYSASIVPGIGLENSAHGTYPNFIFFYEGTANTNFQILRDTSSWYHLVVSKNNSNVKTYLNSVLLGTVTDTLASTYWDIAGKVFTIGAWEDGANAFDGYIAEFNLIDGQSLRAGGDANPPYYFGQLKNGTWIPYSAFTNANSSAANSVTASNNATAIDSYGTNGFRLRFDSSDITGSGNNVFSDVSHNTNNFTATNF